MISVVKQVTEHYLAQNQLHGGVTVTDTELQTHQRENIFTDFLPLDMQHIHVQLLCLDIFESWKQPTPNQSL